MKNSMKSSSIKIILVSLVLMPVSLCAAAVGLGTLTTVANTLADGVVTSLGYLFFTVAVVAFFWGIVQFIWAARNGDAGDGVKNGKQFMLWGLIALFVMFSVWGIIQFAQGVFGLSGQTTITIPNIQLLGATPSTNNNNGTTATAVACSGTNTSSGAKFCGILNASNSCVQEGGWCESRNTSGVVSCGVLNVSQNCVGQIPKGGSTGTGPTCTAPTVSDGTRCVDPSCQSAASGDACTTKNAAGTDVTGTCNNVKQCVPSTGGGSVGAGGSCRISSECSGNLVCNSNSVCSVPSSGGNSGSVGFGGSCQNSSACSGNLVCDMNKQCRYPEGANCTDDFQCAGAGVCDTSTKKCL